ncbi:hypothetical protein Taro_049649 [Colocasia esculenta]|uniref:Uncharacterized protein n=1 Tax=Colocasia esculenta TaxID=4460 RepID=A0A843XBC3_COLES|nr:hypothetical protein [Colocasia esculenta]
MPTTEYYKAAEQRNATRHNQGTYNSCKGSVDTAPTGVDTMLQTQGKMMKKWSRGADTRSSCVDTRFGSHKACLSVLYSVSTQPEVVSTLETLPREPFVPVWDSVSTHSMVWCRHTPAETQKREFLWTRGCLGIRGFDLGFRAHAPQGTLWTYGAINTHVPCTPKAREPIHFQKKLFGNQWGLSRSCSISRSCRPSLQEEGRGNQGESLERSLLC